MTVGGTPLVKEGHRQACIQYDGRCCNYGSSEHRLYWIPAPFQIIFSLLNPEFATVDPDGSVFITCKTRLEVASLAPTTLGTIQPLKEIVMGIRLFPMWKHRECSHRRPPGPLPQRRLRARLCIMALNTPQIVSRTHDNPVYLGYSLLPTRDGSKTVISHR